MILRQLWCRLWRGHQWMTYTYQNYQQQICTKCGAKRTRRRIT